MRAIRALIAIMLILAMAAVPAAAYASACHESGQAVQDHHEHHHAMAAAPETDHHAMGPATSHADPRSHQAGHGCDNGCLSACCSGFLDAPASGLPLRASRHQAALPLPLDAKAGESRTGLLERPPRLL